MSVRVTRKIRRVLDRLAVQGPGTLHEIAADTNINWPVLQPILFKLEDEEWVTVSDSHQWKITELGRTQRKADTSAVQAARENTPRTRLKRPDGTYMDDPRRRGPRPPYTQRRDPWPRGEGRPRD